MDLIVLFKDPVIFFIIVSMIFFLIDWLFIISLISTFLFLSICLLWNAIAPLSCLLRLDLSFSELFTHPGSSNHIRLSLDPFFTEVSLFPDAMPVTMPKPERSLHWPGISTLFLQFCCLSGTVSPSGFGLNYPRKGRKLENAKSGERRRGNEKRMRKNRNAINSNSVDSQTE